MKTFILISSVLFFSATAFAGDKKIKLNNASWKSDLAIQNKVEEESPVRVPSQNKKHLPKQESKAESWNYVGPDQVDVEVKFDSSKD